MCISTATLEILDTDITSIGEAMLITDGMEVEIESVPGLMARFIAATRHFIEDAQHSRYAA
jgi:hypothetical protein